MERRIRKIRLLSTKTGESVDAFIFGQTEDFYEVLLADAEHFETFHVNRETLVSSHGIYQMYYGEVP